MDALEDQKDRLTSGLEKLRATSEQAAKEGLVGFLVGFCGSLVVCWVVWRCSGGFGVDFCCVLEVVWCYSGGGRDWLLCFSLVLLFGALLFVWPGLVWLGAMRPEHNKNSNNHQPY